MPATAVAAPTTKAQTGLSAAQNREVSRGEITKVTSSSIESRECRARFSSGVVAIAVQTVRSVAPLGGTRNAEPAKAARLSTGAAAVRAAVHTSTAAALRDLRRVLAGQSPMLSVT
jgi:hypothetical protein